MYHLGRAERSDGNTEVDVSNLQRLKLSLSVMNSQVLMEETESHPGPIMRVCYEQGS